MPWFKKNAFWKTIAFDIGGVVMKGDFWTEEQTPMHGTRELIESLNDNYKTALATNNNALAFTAFDGRWAFRQLFDFVLVSGEIGVKKPDAAYFKKLIHLVNSKPSDIIFFDDQAENVEAAKKVGIKGVVFKDANQAREALKAMGIKV
jgi:HAD superfamily hydrolase (TIGR01509 family)